jgi:hypothetical protein
MASPPSNGRRRRLHGAVAAGATAVAVCSGLLAGCGGSSKGSGPAGDATATAGASAGTVALPPDQPQKAACGLVTPAEVEAALGAKVSPGKEDVQEARSLCAFSLASSADQRVVLLATSSSGVPAAFDAARAKADSPQAVSAGEQAFVSGAQALVRKGNTMVAILVIVRQPPARLASAATKLAVAVGNHL